MQRIVTVLVVAIAVLAAGLGYLAYAAYLQGGATGAQNWAGYVDRETVGSANATLALPASSDWHGSGAASLWVGMGGFVRGGSVQWPFWQAGVVVTCSSGLCTVELFDEGGTHGPPCNGTCAADWTQPLGSVASTTISVSVSGGSSGALAVFVVDQNGFNTTYRPPPWTVLAGVTSFPSADWIFESPEGAHGTDAMPTLTPPGVTFSSLHDSTDLGSVVTVAMQGNPNGQSVSLSPLNGDAFSAYSYDV